ncbi:MAG TPA: nuclear transport factor 2 family protein [Stellaceae bacterium]|nr:nuclear transport factor 2 family protein [Stellaceae bacterium]
MSATGSVEDRLAIRELMESYADAVVRRSSADWGATWAEDGTWSLVGKVAQGRHNIVALWEELMANFPFVCQYPTCGGIKVAGNTAAGTWYLLEMCETPDGKEMLYSGRYDDTYVKGGDGNWRFKSRSYTVLHIQATGKG